MAVATTMSGVVLTGHGGPETLEWRDDLAVPALAETDVLVEVRAAGVNNTDINTRIGWYSKGDFEAEDASWSGTPLSLPRIQGADVCGVIADVGAAVDRGRIGERVLIEPCLVEADGHILETSWYFGSECDGGFAQYARVAERHAHRVESALSDVELASFPCSYSTAENMLTRAGVAAGETVLVTGASGGVGSAAVQLARARGARVIAVTSAAKAERLRALGAERTLDRGDDPAAVLGHSAVDVVVDLVGGSSWPSLLDVMKPHGRYSVAGAIGGHTVPLDLRTLYLKDLSFFGCTVLGDGVFAALVKRIESGEIQPLVAQTFPLREIAAAQEAFGEKGYVGKIVLEV
ncbi:MAG: alcohol dehydrogenase family protein [Pseudomonadota bacterium]